MLRTSNDISTALENAKKRRKNRPDGYRTVALMVGGILLASIILAMISGSIGSDSAENSFYYALFWTVSSACLVSNIITLLRATLEEGYDESAPRGRAGDALLVSGLFDTAFPVPALHHQASTTSRTRDISGNHRPHHQYYRGYCERTANASSAEPEIESL